MLSKLPVLVASASTLNAAKSLVTPNIAIANAIATMIRILARASGIETHLDIVRPAPTDDVANVGDLECGVA